MKKFDAEKVLALCEAEKATVLFAVPTMMDLLAKAVSFETADLSRLRFAVVGGEAMSLKLIQFWQRKGLPIRQGYGLTEFGPSAFSLNEEDSVRKIGSIGFPNFYVDAKIADPFGEEVPQGTIGELLLRGPVCTPGYWRDPAATAELIRDGWLYTGDLVRQDRDGFYFVAGRKKEMFISGGENVYPVEVERFLSTHAAIREVAVVGVPDSRWGEVGKAYVSLHPGADLSFAELKSFCAGGLAKYKIPKSIEILSVLPKSESGKILKRDLPSVV